MTRKCTSDQRSAISDQQLAFPAVIARGLTAGDTDVRSEGSVHHLINQKEGSLLIADR
jgi:hypothetical protein